MSRLTLRFREWRLGLVHRRRSGDPRSDLPFPLLQAELSAALYEKRVRISKSVQKSFCPFSYRVWAYARNRSFPSIVPKGRRHVDA